MSAALRNRGSRCRRGCQGETDLQQTVFCNGQEKEPPLHHYLQTLNTTFVLPVLCLRSTTNIPTHKKTPAAANRMLQSRGCKVQSHAAFTNVSLLRGACPAAVLGSPLGSCTNADPPVLLNTGNTHSAGQGQAHCSQKACCEHQVRQAAGTVKVLSPNRSLTGGSLR